MAPTRSSLCLRRLLWDESGATSIEYAMVGTLVSIFIIGSLMAFEGALNGVFTFVHTTVTAAMGS